MELGSGMVEVGVAEAKKERLNRATRERKYVTRVNLVQQRGRSVAAKHATRPFRRSWHEFGLIIRANF